MTRLTQVSTLKPILGMTLAALIMAGCTTAAPTTGVGSASSSSVDSRPSTSARVPGLARSSAGLSACSRGASGKAGVPSEDSVPLLTIRFFSYWFQTGQYGADAVVYQDGSVAAVQPASKVTKRPTYPLRPLVGGKFSACAVDELVADFGVLAAADLGEPMIWDATEASIEMTGRAVPGVPMSLYVNGYGSQDDIGNLTPAQKQARRDIVAWVDRITHVDRGVPLPMDRLAVVDNIPSLGSPYPRATVAWTAPHPQPQACLTVSGPDVQAALTSVRESFRQVKRFDHWSTPFTGTFRVGQEDRQLDIMVLPPALTC